VRSLLGCALATFAVLVPATADAAGISARFGDVVATVGKDIVARVDIRDDKRITKRVRVELRRVGESEWTRVDATPPSGMARWWVATFTSTTVWNEGGIRVAQPDQVELRAFLYGARGGVLLVIGDIEPLTLDVLAPSEAEARERALAVYDRDVEDEQFSLTGYVGTEGRAGSSARARLFIGAGGNVAPNVELLVYVGVGPAFSTPTIFADGGPLVLGFDLAMRLFARSPHAYRWSPFIEPFATVDVRLPGVDPGGGARAGVLYQVSAEIAAELSVGGAVMAFNVAGGPEAELGASGMLRLAVRFGGEQETDEP
jgi:hypothetical protein